MQKTITKTDWNKMKTFAQPTKTTGGIKQDDNGNLWEWVAGGKRVDVKGVRVSELPAEAFK